MVRKKEEDKYIPSSPEAEYDHYLSSEEEIQEKQRSEQESDEIEREY
ncbi:MAG: hypothetical protein ACK5LC_12510 [Coprobacillaceae bacterium]